MHHIHENQMAFDTGSLGFPSILGCQAICVHTSRGLYGFHDAKSGARGTLTGVQVSDAKLSIFATWVASKMQPTETQTAIYGVINRSEQYTASATGNADWATVLTNLAQAMNFTGDVYGARINSHVEKKGNERSVYVEFNLAGNDVTVGFKRWSKMDFDATNKVLPQVQDRVIPSGLGFASAGLYGSGTVAPTIRKDGKAFNLNTIAMKKFFKFQ